ncbi:MAG TPA: polysaccharide biosynthesis/export family protein [Planctomycetota bacterium]|nr:polysaccharide biosynthesis/export family protein [Planctomycetota bacterium]
MRYLLLVPLLLLGACAGAPPFDARAVAMEWATYMQRDYTLRPGDKLSVRVDQLMMVSDSPTAGSQAGQEAMVSPTGTIDLQRLSGPIQVAGKTVGAARVAIVEAYKQMWPDPRVSLAVSQPAVQSIYVCGEVRTPGVHPYVPGMTMVQAVSAAGSFLVTVKESDIRILRINPDGTQRTFRVNMGLVLEGEYPDFLLLPGDVIYCQTSGIADVGNVVELYVRRLLPFSLGGPSVGNLGLTGSGGK